MLEKQKMYGRKGENDMRKSAMYRCALAALAAGAMTNTAYAASVGTYNIPGGQAIVIGGSNQNDLREVLEQLKGSLGGACSGNLSLENLGGGCLGDLFSGNLGGNFDCGQGGPMIPNKPGVPDKPEVPDKPGVPDKPEVPDKPGVPDEPEIPDGSQDAYAKQVVSLVNAERAKAGLPALKIHTKAESAALLRAKEIERSFSHTRPNGSDFSTVLTSAGISFQSAGENIAYGQKTPSSVMNDWMNSSGHRANILNANFTSMAVGHYQNSAGVDYWVQLFLR